MYGGIGVDDTDAWALSDSLRERERKGWGYVITEKHIFRPIVRITVKETEMTNN